MRIARELYEQIVAHAREEAPNECCGMVGSSDGSAVQVYRAVNAEASPLRFRIDPREQYELHTRIDDAGLELGAIYHSHTRTAPRPSQTDINFAKLWPGVLWIIVGLEWGRGRRANLANRRRKGVGRRAGRGAEPCPDSPQPRVSSIARLAARSITEAERFCPDCKLPLVHAEGVIESVSERHERARKIKPQMTEGRLVRVAGARNQAEAELIQGLLLEEGVPSMLRRSAGFDVPDFLAAGPRDVLVPESALPTAREVLLQGELISEEPPARVVAPGRLLAGLLVALALGALVVWLVSQAAH